MKRIIALLLTVSLLCMLPVHAYAMAAPDAIMFDSDGYLTEEGMSIISGCMPDVEYTQVVEEDAVYLYAIDPDTNEQFLAYRVYRETLYGGYPTIVSAGYIVGQITAKRLPDGYGIQEDTRLSQGILNVPIVRQDNYNCWAAVCAMIIRYKTCIFRTASELCYESTGSYDAPANWTTILECYQRYYMSPSQISGICPYSTVRSYITANQPLHIGCVQLTSDGNDSSVKHSMVLIGFNGVSGTCFLYANDPSTGTRVSTPVNPGYTVSDKVIFSLPGSLRVRWNMTRYGFYPSEHPEECG